MEPMTTAWVSTPEPALDRTFAHVAAHWSDLTRPGAWLAFSLPHPYVRPGGFFKMFVYWDTYFILLGLVVQGQWELAAGMVDNLLCAVERLGHIPGYISSKTACRSRSQSPYLTAAISEVLPYRSRNDPAWLARAAAAAEREYQEYWTAEPHLTELGLSRYVDPGADGCVTVPDTPHHRAMAESGWDNTGRFGNDTTAVVPVDLNAQLFRYEQDLGRFHELLGQPAQAAAWRGRAAQRRALIDRYLWVKEDGCYSDWDLRAGRPLAGTPRALSSFVPLWAGVADAAQAARMVAQLPLFEHQHGLAACEPGWDDGTEHNHPTGWAYSHWYVAAGLQRYGYHEQACRVALKWLRLVAGTFERTGRLWERYNVVDPDGPTPGRYRPQAGFGWTNGVFAALLARVVLGIDPDRPSQAANWLPPSWRQARIRAFLPSYPWPTGTSTV
jgi:alpha,alpha-trehalase